MLKFNTAKKLPAISLIAMLLVFFQNCGPVQLKFQSANSSILGATSAAPADHPGALAQLSAERCALNTLGQIYCWGYNGNGQLGNGTTTDFLIPTPVSLPRLKFVQVVSGAYTSCGLASTGQTYCWGAGGAGELGNGSTSDSSLPILVTQPAGVIFSQLALGYGGVCGITPAGQTYCWGLNSLGNNSTVGSLIPVPVSQPAGLSFIQVGIGGYGGCGLSSAGQAYCWGGNYEGGLGNGGVPTYNLTPGPVSQPAGIFFSQISQVERTACAATKMGQAYCWGSNTVGQIGDGTKITAMIPTPVSQPSGVIFNQVVTGPLSTCALTPNGQAYCWGMNIFGQLGNGTQTDSLIPVPVTQPNGIKFVQIALEQSSTCALTASGQAYCWGGLGVGPYMLGNGSFGSSVPVPVTQ